MRSHRLMSALLVLALASGCSSKPELDVRTFDLKYISPDQAAQLISPYVFRDRPDAPGQASVSHEPQALTVRETRENLEKIARVLAEYDRPAPAVALHFQIIEADGAAAPDPAIADVEAALRKVFRFRGYRLVADALIQASTRSEFRQATGERAEYTIDGSVWEVQADADTGTVRLGVRLFSRTALVFETSVTARLGQTLVLGTAQPDPARGALILTVRPGIEKT